MFPGSHYLPQNKEIKGNRSVEKYDIRICCCFLICFCSLFLYISHHTGIRYYIPWRRKWQPTPVFLPGESHGWRSLVGYNPCGHKESDTTERLHFSGLKITKNVTKNHMGWYRNQKESVNDKFAVLVGEIVTPSSQMQKMLTTPLKGLTDLILCMFGAHQPLPALGAIVRA